MKVFGAVVGDGRVSSVRIDLNETVDDLKHKIWEEVSDLTRSRASALTLYLAKREGKWLKGVDEVIRAVRNGEVPEAIKTLMQAPMWEGLELNDDACFGKTFSPTPRDIHVLVELPNAKKRRCGEKNVDSTSVETAVTDYSDYRKCDFVQCSLPPVKLPSLDALRAFVASPLPLKIGLETSAFNQVAAHVEKLIFDQMCLVNENAPCRKLFQSVLTRALNPLPLKPTENECRELRNALVREPIERLFAAVARTNNAESKDPSRPDMYLDMHGVCVFRGEEVPADAGVEAAQERLLNDFVWIFGPHVPYVLAYAASGIDCVLLAIYSPDTVTIKTHEIGRYRMDTATARFEFLLATLHLTCLFRAIFELCPPSTDCEFVGMVRTNGVVVRLHSNSVEKDYSRRYRDWYDREE